MIEEPDLEDEPQPKAAAPLPPPMPPPTPAEHAPPPPVPEPSAAEPDAVEELSPDDLVAAEGPREGVPDGVIESALARARSAVTEEGARRRIEFYERELAALGPEGDRPRIGLYQHEIGALHEDSADEGAAVKAYARALQSDATLKPNLWAIRRVFERRALWPNLLKLLDAEIRFAATDEERAELYVEKGQLVEDRLGDAEAARACYEKAVEIAPRAIGAWLALEKLCARSGDLGRLQRALRGQADAVEEPGRKVALLLDLARLQEQVEGGSLDQAIALCREAHAVAGEPAVAERALRELERLAGAAGRTDELLWALEMRAQAEQRTVESAPPHEKPAAVDRLLTLRRRQALLVRGLEGGGAKAWEYLEDALKHAPADPLLERDLGELAESLGRWDELAAVLGKRAQAASGAERVALELERAEALRKAGKATEADAVEAEVAQRVPQHLGLIVQREREHLRAGDWERLAQLYVGEAELALAGRTPTGANDPVWAATAFAQAGVILAEHLGREAEAEAALQRAIEAVPGFRLALDALERLYARGGKHVELAALLEAQLAEGPPPAQARRLLEELLAVRESGLDDPAGAAQVARRLAALRPDDVRVRLRAIELERAAGRFTELVEDLRELANLLPEDRRADVLVERAEVLEKRLGDDDAAALAYKEVLALEPGEPRAAEAFEALSRRKSGRSGSGSHSRPRENTPAPATESPQVWDDLAQALRREADASLSPERVTQVLLKLGEIHERERGAFADAAQTYRDLLDKVPGHPAALRGLQRAQAALNELARRAEADEQEIEALGDAPTRGRLLTLLGELHEDRLRSDEQAADAYHRALELEGAHAPSATLGRLRVALRRGDGPAAIDAWARLEQQLGGDEASGALAALLDERAWALRALGEHEAAGGVVREALGQSGAIGHGPRLQRVRLAARAGEGLDDALDALAASGSDPQTQALLERRAGLQAMARGGDGWATGLDRLQRAFGRVPTDADTVVLLADAGARDPDLLKARAQLAEPADQAAWLLERAESLESLGRLAEAAREAERALAADPRSLPALELVRRLARAGGDDAGLARATAALAVEVLDVERSAALHAEAAAAFEGLGLNTEAAAAWRAVLDRTPRDGAAFNRARNLMQALAAMRKDPRPLVELYSYRLQHVEDPTDRVPVLLDRAEVLAEAGDLAGAERDLRAILELQAEHTGAMRRLAELLAQAAPGHAEAVALLERYLSLETAQEHRRNALLRLAELLEQANRAEEAVARLEEAIALSPSPQAAVADREKLAALLQRLRHWQRAVEALRKLAELAPTPHERAHTEVRIAQLYRDGFADQRAAAEALGRALAADPLHTEALEKLVALAEQKHLTPIELDDKLEKSMRAARAFITERPQEASGYRVLLRLCGWRGDEDARTVAAQAVALVSGEVPLERDDAIDPTKEPSAAGWERLWPEPARAVALEVWRLMAEAVARIHGPSIESLRVGKGDRVNPKALPPGWAHLDKIARSLGAQGYELYAAHDREVLALGANGDTPAVVAGAAYTEKLTPRLRFRVGRALALLRDRLGPVEKVELDELQTLFAACAKVAEVSRPASVRPHSEAAVDERAKQLGKLLGRKERKALQALGSRWALLPEPGSFRHAVEQGAVRMGLLLCGDLQASLAELGMTLDEPRARPLVEFALSDDFVLLRREMGLRA